jgi:hypothetical protein
VATARAGEEQGAGDDGVDSGEARFGLRGGRRLAAGGACAGVGVEVTRSRSPAAHPRLSSRTQRSKQARLGFFGHAAAGDSGSRGGGSREEGRRDYGRRRGMELGLDAALYIKETR